MAITPLPTPPSRSDSNDVFVARSDAFIGALPQFVTEANAQAAALTLNSVSDVSVTSNLVGLGAKTFIVTAGKSFQPGMYLVIADALAPSTNSMVVQVTSYIGTSLVVNATTFTGTGTFASWVISLTAASAPPPAASVVNIPFGNIIATNVQSAVNELDTEKAALSGATFTGGINEARGAVVMHATTMNLWAQPNTIDGTGAAVIITAIVNAPQAGAKRALYPITGTTITHGATFSVQGGASYVTAAGDALEFEAVTVSTYKVNITKADGAAVTGVVLASLAEVKAGVDATKLVTPSTMQSGKIVNSAVVALTGLTAADFTGVPSWATRITVTLDAVSTNGSSVPIIQIGDAGGIETTVYDSNAGGINNAGAAGTTASNFTTGFALYPTWASTAVARATFILNLHDLATNKWVGGGLSNRTDVAQVEMAFGGKALTATLDRVRFTTVNGTDAFDAGNIKLSWE